MARLPRLVVAGHAHLVILRALAGVKGLFDEEADRASFTAALREAAATERVQVHAWALLDTEALLLATPAEAQGLGRWVQALGRRFVTAYNRRHQRTGTLWEGRFRGAVVEPGAPRVAALLWVDGQSADPALTSAGHRGGGPRDALLTDLPEFWLLGNTPFEREAAWRARLAEGLPAAEAAELRRAALGGWAIGDDAFKAALATAASRPAAPRPRGRPPGSVKSVRAQG
jgi:putative transposase